MASVEKDIQGFQPWIRDHVVHAVNTFILGVYIIKKAELKPVNDRIYQKKNWLPSLYYKYFPLKYYESSNFYFMWKLCGPTHDLGYPLEIAHSITDPFFKKMDNILAKLKSPSPRIIQQNLNLDKLCDDIDANKIDANKVIQKSYPKKAI